MKPAGRAVAAVTLVAALATACGAQSSGGDNPLPPLHLTDVGAGQRALGLPDPAYGGTPAGTPAGTGSPYVLRTTLPTGTPAPAPVWRFPKPTAAQASRVAAALGVAATPTAVPGGWVARSGSHLLTVRADAGWAYGVDCTPNVPIEQESLQVACGSAVTTPAQPAGPTADRARELADPILHGLGWADGEVTVVAGSPTTTVTARRTVGGTDTTGWLTTLSFTVGDLLDTANGWSTEPLHDRDYPLVDAATAFRTLQEQPRPMPLLCRARTDGQPGCEPLAPVVVSGVRLGLALRHEPDRGLLVPAWLFEVSGSSEPLAVVAVAPQFLATPTPTPVPMGTPKRVPPSGPR